MPFFRVAIEGLNLRRVPSTRPRANIVTVLRRGHRVEKIEETATGDWWRVRTTQSGVSVEGWLAPRSLSDPDRVYVVPAESLREPTESRGIRPVHLTTADARLDDDERGAFKLSEPGAPVRAGRSREARAASLLSIVRFLDVERSARYAKRGRTTFCNVYAYDYCTLGKAYLPRVWWKPRALHTLLDGGSVPVRYAQTIREMTANDLTEWLEEWGQQFGWQRVHSLDELQAAANQGRVAVICAARTDRDRPGHICVVPPESDAVESERSTDGTIKRPVYSQAGATNCELGTCGAWWQRAKFAEFGFWYAGTAPANPEPPQFEPEGEAEVPEPDEKLTLRRAIQRSAAGIVEAQTHIDEYVDEEIVRAVRESRERGIPLSGEWAELLLPVLPRIKESTSEIEFEFAERKGVEFSIGLDVGLKPVHEFYAVQYASEERLRHKIKTHVRSLPSDRITH